MPNWCLNELTIEGSPKELSKLMKQVEITDSEQTSEHYPQVISCHKVIPRPAIKDNDWYDWNISNWGSKWDLSDPVRDDSQWENGKLIYCFSTAWSPVIEVISALAKEHKKLSFTYTYWEGGSDYWGEHEYKKGEETSYEGGSINDASCERLEYLMGEHHQCQECWEAVECAGDTTPDLCDECLQNAEIREMELWEGEEQSTLTDSDMTSEQTSGTTSVPLVG
jgi:hypothetical protein